MRKAFKVVIAAIITPVLIMAAYICFLWATYIDDVVISGEKYGFITGSTKQQTYKNIEAINKKYPELKIYIPYGPHAGDNKTLPSTKDNYQEAEKYNQWELLLDGDGEFFNVIRLSHEDNTLVQIYRHRKYFELL